MNKTMVTSGVTLASAITAICVLANVKLTQDQLQAIILLAPIVVGALLSASQLISASGRKRLEKKIDSFIKSNGGDK